MAIVFPSWYDGGFEDTEDVVCSILEPYYDQCDPKPKIVTFLPSDYGADGVIVRVHRSGGLSGPASVMHDTATVQIATMAASRRDAFEVAEFTRQTLLAYGREGGVVQLRDGNTATVHQICDVKGPQVLPEYVKPTLRLIVNHFQVVTYRTTAADYVPHL